MHNSRAAVAVVVASAVAKCECEVRPEIYLARAAMICEGLHADERDCELDWCDRSQATLSLSLSLSALLSRRRDCVCTKIDSDGSAHARAKGMNAATPNENYDAPRV
jgi:hypothetical protein